MDYFNLFCCVLHMDRFISKLFDNQRDRDRDIVGGNKASGYLRLLAHKNDRSIVDIKK